MEATVTRAVGNDPHGYVDKLLIVEKSTPMPREVFYVETCTCSTVQHHSLHGYRINSVI